MVARDDSVIRGSLIASLIFLVLSLALNFFLWRWGDTQATEAERANGQLASANDSLRKKTSQADLMKAMLGAGEVSEATFELLRESATGDAEMEAVEQDFVRNMAYFGPEVDAANRNYSKLPEYLVNAIRSRNDQYNQAVQEATTVRQQATSDVEIAKLAQTKAETVRDETIAKLDKAMTEFTED
ncbi:MAG: hypothetical protein ACO1RT_21010, partial [Planctomycetaceae bacterium]